MFIITLLCYLFFFNDPSTTDIYTLSLHDALPIFRQLHHHAERTAARNDRRLVDRIGRNNVEADDGVAAFVIGGQHLLFLDRKSTRLNSSHVRISYAVFCLKKKKKEFTTNA